MQYQDDDLEPGAVVSRLAVDHCLPQNDLQVRGVVVLEGANVGS